MIGIEIVGEADPRRDIIPVEMTIVSRRDVIIHIEEGRLDAGGSAPSANNAATAVCGVTKLLFLALVSTSQRMPALIEQVRIHLPVVLREQADLGRIGTHVRVAAAEPDVRREG